VHCFMTPYLVCHVGRGAKEANLYTEISEGIYSYGITRHRHGKILFWNLEYASEVFKHSCLTLGAQETNPILLKKKNDWCLALYINIYIFGFGGGGSMWCD
jgi:hypothetical protein